MARVTGRLVMTGNKDGECTMNVEFSDTTEPHLLRTDGYYWMLKEIKRRASIGVKELKPDVPGSAGNVAAASVDEVRSVESESSSESPKPTTRGSLLMDTAEIDSPPEVRSHKAEDYSKQEIALKMEDTTEKKDAKKEAYSRDSPEWKESMKAEGSAKGASVKEEGLGQGGLGKGVLERSPPAVELKPHLGHFAEKPVRAVGRAPIGPLRRVGGADEVETEVEEVDDYFVVGEDVNKPVSLCLLPLELEKGLTIGGSNDTTELSVRGKSNAVDIMRPISAWKLVFPDDLSFQILVKITQKNDKKWVKLGKPRARFKEKLEDVFLVARVLALLKTEPQASEDRAWNHLLEGDLTLETTHDLLRLRCTLMEQFINLDPALREANAQKTLLSLLGREKEANLGKRLVSDRDSLDEVGTQSVKKAKIGTVPQKSEKLATRVGSTSYPMSEDVSMAESDNEEEYYDGGEADDSDEEFGDSFCIFCDDGGSLLCCDGPCMRSFHATKLAGRPSGCRTLGLTEAEVAGLVGMWLCKNCTYKQHQCYVCGELGASAPKEASGIRQEVFVCNVACCGRFYHPKCIASRLNVAPSLRETTAENIQNGKESFTCPLHACKACRKGENREVEDLILVKCRRCPTAWHKKCLPRDICFEEEAKVWKVDIRAWTFGERNKQLICYCLNHAIISALGTPSRKHVKFGLSPEEKAKEVEEVEKAEQKNRKVASVTKEPAHCGPKTSLTAASMGKSADKKYASADLLVKPKTDWFSGPSSVSQPSSSISKDALKKSEESLWRTVQSVVTRSKQRVTERSVKDRHECSLPGIYKSRKTGNKEFMKMGMVQSILEAAKSAMDKIKLARINEAMTICDKQTVQTVWHEEERLRTYLSPTLFGKRYTSYGRHFTKIPKLEKVVEILQPYILDRDTIVDFSCGDNSFCRLLREDLSKVGKPNCQFKNFDLFPSNDSFGFERKDWFEVGLNDCGPGDNLVIGLNPPFAFVEKFVSHALGMNPRLLVLIVPPMKKNLEHLGYECLVDDDSLMAEKSFYLPGSVNEKSTECLEQGNNVAPHFFIFCSRKFSNRSRVGFAEAPEWLSQGNLLIRKSEKPAKPSPLSVSAANIFIPSVPPRPHPGQAPKQKAPGKVASALRKRDPRQPPQVPRQAVPGFVDVDAQEEGESEIARRHRMFITGNNNNNNNMRPPWRLDVQQQLPPPPPFPPHLAHMRGMPPRHHPGAFPPFFPRPFCPDEYSPNDPGLFPPRNPFMHPGRPPHDGFYRGPRPPEEFYPGPRPPRQRQFSPEENDGSFGGWID